MQQVCTGISSIDTTSMSCHLRVDPYEDNNVMTISSFMMNGLNDFHSNLDFT